MNKTQETGQQVQPYLFFDGKCEEALDFYKSALGARVEMMMRFKDNPDPMPSEAITSVLPMWKAACITLFSDPGAHMPEFKGFSLSVNAPNEKEADKLFAALGNGGKVVMPLAKTFYSPRFGMVTDKFGVGWMVIVPQAM